MRFMIICSLWMMSATIASAEVTVMIELSEVSVQQTKPSGKQWDFGLGKMSRPDLLVTIYLDGTPILKSKKYRDTFSAQFSERSLPLTLSGKRTLTVRLVDSDLRHDDLIDQLSVEVSEDDALMGRSFRLTGRSTLNVTLKMTPLSVALPTSSPSNNKAARLP